jgi:DnaJ-class molecular chaperone
MEKAKHKAICDHCKGNGYLRENTSSYVVVHQCPTCISEGEVFIDDPTPEELEELVEKARLQ